jgi:ATP-dependent helicase/nuclease subunit A
LDTLLADDSGQAPLLVLVAAGVRLDRLRDLALRCHEHWDLLAAAELTTLSARPMEVDSLIAALDRALEARSRCTDVADKLFVHLGALEGFAALLRATTEELELLQLLADAPRLSVRYGRQENWGGDAAGVRDELACADRSLRDAVGSVTQVALSQLIVALRAQLLAAADDRRRIGQLEFHDLLVRARNLVRDDGEVRALVRDQYRHLFVDEFQDTDPLQAEMVVRLSSSDPDPKDKPWTSLELEPGRVFFVGDPQQSIYRFRHADIAVFLDARQRYVAAPLVLTRNHRSVPGLVSWINSVFAQLIGAGEARAQPAFQALGAQRPKAALERSPVVVIGGKPEDPDAGTDDVRAAEASEIAQLLCAARSDRWPVGDEARPARFADMTVLVPTRTGLGILLDALDHYGVPFRLETSSLVYSSPEVTELLAVLRSIDDPCDEPATLAAVRSAAFGCGDDDLLEYARAGGGWDYRRAVPEALGADHPVAVAFGELRVLHEQRWWCDVSSLVDQIVGHTRLLALGLDSDRFEESWRRIQVVTEHARRFDEVAGGGLRQFLAWTELQTGERARFTDVSIADPDHDAVRIMTIHAAKGLEFPIVALAGLGVQRAGQGGTRVVWRPDGPHISLSPLVHTVGFDAAADYEDTMDQLERLRLLYVGATRARDHLIVSVHHRPHHGQVTLASQVEGVLDAAVGLFCGFDDACGTSVAPPIADAQPEPPTHPGTAPRPSTGLEALGVQELPLPPTSGRSAWLAERAALLAAASTPTVVAASSLGATMTNPGEVVDVSFDVRDEGDINGTVVARRRGRAGTAVGRSVHAVLQGVDLANPAMLDTLCDVESAAEGVAERANEVRALVRAALASEPIRAAVASGRSWRELYVGAPLGVDAALEGFVDLLIDGPDGLWVVDYKTDRVDGPAEVDAAIANYRLQGAAYAVAVEQVAQRPVTRVSFVFLTVTGALVRDLDDLSAAKTEVVGLVTGP